MREIKFRLYHGSLMYDNFIIDFEKNWVIVGKSYLGLDNVLLMQYTGLKDKHGKEIYEGDIVKHRKLDSEKDIALYGLKLWFDTTMEVKYQNLGFSPLDSTAEYGQKDLEWEIIGNVYENSELLKEQIK